MAQQAGDRKILQHVPAGYGKVAVLRQLQDALQIADDRVIYSGDGSSDIHVMLHVNQRKGYTVAVSQTDYVAQIAKRTVLSDDACGVLIPVLEDICSWDSTRIRSFFELHDLLIQEWAKMRTDWLTIRTNL
jgi:predicted HAD superfamily phosphohydrolase